MSGDSRASYAVNMNSALDYTSDDEEKRRGAYALRSARIASSTAKAAYEPALKHAKAPEPLKVHIDRSLAKSKITSPPTWTEDLHICLIDNSGSNREIALALRRAAGYVHAVCGTLAQQDTIAFQFFSDHCDPIDEIYQEVDYTTLGDQGEKVLRASIDAVRGSGGGDSPEAIECALDVACRYDFGKVPKEKRHLYLVTDVVAHGMCPEGVADSGCPDQKDWKKSLMLVGETYGSFQVIASGDDRTMFKAQKKFLSADRLRYDLVDLSTGNLSHAERCRLVANALLLLMMRNRGQAIVSTFLMTLLEKWLAEPQYGSNTLPKAKQQITDFCQYLEISDTECAELLTKIFAGTDAK